MTEQEIYKKANAIKQKNEHINFCLDVDICPDCGEIISSKTSRIGMMCPTLCYYKCESCGFYTAKLN